jgi:hypothetical protein
MWPVWVGAGLTAAGTITAIGFGLARGTAQDNADAVEQQIRDAGGGAGTCTPAGLAAEPRFTEACGVLADNRNLVNVDATLANVGIGVAVGAAVLTVGYILFGPKDARPAAAGAMHTRDGQQFARPSAMPGLGSLGRSSALVWTFH